MAYGELAIPGEHAHTRDTPSDQTRMVAWAAMVEIFRNASPETLDLLSA
jgi:hypothetical protein